MQGEVEIALAIIVDALHRMKNDGDLCRHPLEDPFAFIKNEAEMILFLERLGEQDFQLIEKGLYFFYHQENYHTLNSASRIVPTPLSQRTESDRNAYEHYLRILRNRLNDDDFSSLTIHERNFCQRKQEEQYAIEPLANLLNRSDLPTSSPRRSPELPSALNVVQPKAPEVDQSALINVREKFNQMRGVIYERAAIQNEEDLKFAMVFALKAQLRNDPENNSLIEWVSKKEIIFFNEKKIVESDKPYVAVVL